MQSSSQDEADRLLQIANTLLDENDLTAARDFALLAQETDSLLEGSDQITAIVDVLIAANQQINNHHNYYNILQIENNRYNDQDRINQQYHRLAILLHPDNNKFSSAGTAFKLVHDAWDILSHPVKKSTYDNRLFNVFKNHDNENKIDQNTRKKMHVVVIPAESMPEIVPGKEAYYFRQWPCFPIGFVLPNTVPQPTPKQPEKTCTPTTRTSSRKRGRPVKNPLW
ncbi:DnaJ domain-containing protein [Artemisia annua]|uniref:DnaJ domain-containing protein n=1 Tax=Artemisia annua TaxID=35608 RepID=A0A2U1L0H9_ARTAN|nr:DnaJ domain-containing protein [Artemisia annua]